MQTAQSGKFTTVLIRKHRAYLFDSSLALARQTPNSTPCASCKILQKGLFGDSWVFPTGKWFQTHQKSGYGMNEVD